MRGFINSGPDQTFAANTQVLAEVRAQELHEFRLLRCFLIVLGPGKSLSCRMPLSFLNHYVLLIRDIGLDVRQRKLSTRQ